MIDRIYIRLIGLTSFLFLSLSLFSQVTIGTDEPPVAGAILQLKENNNIGVNSTKGMALPRVRLLSSISLKPIYDETVSDSLKLSNTGLVVYNINTQCPSYQWSGDDLAVLAEGGAVWNGKSWTNFVKNVVSNAVSSITDIEGNKYLVRTFGTAGTWMLENLRTRTYDTESEATTEYRNLLSKTTPRYDLTLTEPTWSYPGVPGVDDGTNSEYFDLDPSIGLLYNLPAALAMSGQVNSVPNRQGICPNGWKIPSRADFDNLMAEINANPQLYSNNNITGVQNIVSNCDIVPIDSTLLAQGRSLPAHKGGFAAKLYTLNHGGTLIKINFTWAYPGFYTTTPYSSEYQGAALVDYTTNLLRFLWLTHSSTQTYIRCIKK